MPEQSESPHSREPRAKARMRKGVLIPTLAVGILVLILGWRLTLKQPDQASSPGATAKEEMTADPAVRADRGVSEGPVESESRPGARVAPEPQPPAPPMTVEERWGVQVTSARMTMADSILDLRFKVIDPEKAAPLGTGQTPAYVFVEGSGERIRLPPPRREGAFPPTSGKLIAGRTYFALLANKGWALKRGGRVTVVIGESRSPTLALE